MPTCPLSGDATVDSQAVTNRIEVGQVVNYPGRECQVLRRWALYRRVTNRMDVRQVVNYPGGECAPSRLKHPPSSEQDKRGQRTAGAQKSDPHKDATLDKSGMHTDAALDESDRQSVTTGLWQFSDREELHEVGGKSSTSGYLHLRIPPEVYIRHL